MNVRVVGVVMRAGIAVATNSNVFFITFFTNSTTIVIENSLFYLNIDVKKFTK